MFDVDFNDLEIGKKKKPTEWAVVCPAGPDREAIKLERCARSANTVQIAAAPAAPNTTCMRK